MYNVNGLLSASDVLYHYSRLVQRWVDYMLGALVTTSRELQEKVIPLLDNLTCQLIALCE